MPTQIQMRRDTAANWAAANPTLASGEWGFETDTGRIKIGDGVSNWVALLYVAPPDAPSDGGTYAREDGAWVDVAQAANLQLRRGTEAERVQITPLEGEPIYATDSKKFYIGDGLIPGGNEIVGAGAGGAVGQQLNPPGVFRGLTMRATGNVGISIKSSTTHSAVRWWDGSVQIGTSTSQFNFSKAVPSTGNWSKSAPKEIFAWSCVSATDATKSGDILNVNTAQTPYVEIGVTNLPALTTLNCGDTGITSLTLRNVPLLDTLFCSRNALTEIDLSDVPSIAILYLDSNSLTSLDVSAAPLLQLLGVHNNPALSYLNLGDKPVMWNLSALNTALSSLTYSNLPALVSAELGSTPFISVAAFFPNGVPPLLQRLNLSDNNITSFDTSGLTALTELRLQNNSLTSLDVSGLTNLEKLFVQNNALTSLRAVGVGQQLGGRAFPFPNYAVDISQNNLSAAALDQFYTDLVSGNGVITVSGNPGTTTDNPSIATAKGHSIYGS